MAYLRKRNKCTGCWNSGGARSKSCECCIIRNCEKLQASESKFCYECDNFPCRRLRNLDKRYKLKYSMSMIDNLVFIQANGIDNFVETEMLRWKCEECGGLICVHNRTCSSCNTKRGSK